jgi:hypothetical protein
MKIVNCKIWFCVLLFSFASFSSNAQEEYKIDDEYTVTLKDSFNFIYRENCGWCPVGCEYGEGKYKIDEDILYLNFFPRYKSEEKIVTIFESDSIQEKVITKKIRVMEDSINGLPGTIVYYSIIKDMHSGTSTDIDGFCNLKFTSENIPDTLTVSFIGFKNVTLPINKKDQEIWVYPAYLGVLDELIDGNMKFKIKKRKKLKRIE